MSQDFFLKISDVDGECRVDGHQKEIQVLSWSHAFNQPTSPSRNDAGGGAVEQANHADFSFTKAVDLASVPLMKLCWSGKTARSAVLTAFRSADGRSAEYLRVEMTNVIVSNISLGGGAGAPATETVTLSYGAVRYAYAAPSADGRPATSLSARHDLGMMKVE